MNVSPIWSRARYAKFSARRRSNRTMERRDAEFEQKMAEVLCVYREVQVLKKAAAKSKKARSKKSGKPVAIVSYD